MVAVSIWLSWQVYKAIMKKHNIDKVPVLLAEDEIVIKKEVSYDQETDELLGFCGKSTHDDGKYHQCLTNLCVKVGNEKVGYQQMQNAFQNNTVGPLARVIMVNPLHPNLPRMVLWSDALDGPNMDTVYTWRQNQIVHSTPDGSSEHMAKLAEVYKAIMKKHNIDKVPVLLAEDEIAIKKEVSYDQETDQLLGFCGKSMHDDVGSLARVIMVNPLHPNLPRMVAFILPTCNKFSHLDVYSQWVKIQKNYEQLADVLGPLIGDSQRRKCMLSLTTSEEGNRLQAIPEILGFIFKGTKIDLGDGTYHVSGLGDQDYIHEHKKLINPLDHPSRIMMMDLISSLRMHKVSSYLIFTVHDTHGPFEACWDATSLSGDNINEIHLMFPGNPPWGLHLHTNILAGDNTQDYAKHIEDAFQDVTETYALFKGCSHLNIQKIVVSKLRNTITDRAAVKIVFLVTGPWMSLMYGNPGGKTNLEVIPELKQAITNIEHWSKNSGDTLTTHTDIFGVNLNEEDIILNTLQTDRVFTDSSSQDLRPFPELTFADVESFAKSMSGCTSTSKAYKIFTEPRYLHSINVTYLEDKVKVAGKCFRSMKKSEPPHILELFITLVNKDVANGKCSCVAGASGFCHHLIGLLFYMAHCKMYGLTTIPDDLTCTSMPQHWSVPREAQIPTRKIQTVLVKKLRMGANYSKFIKSTLYSPSTHYQILCKSDFSGLEPLPLAADIAPTVEQRPNLFKHTTKCGHALKGSVISYQQKISQEYIINDFFAGNFPQLPLQSAEENISNNLQLCLSRENQAALYSLHITHAVAIDIEEKTVTQSRSTLWKLLRSKRITASKYGVGAKRLSKFENLLKQINPARHVLTGPMKRGIELESHAAMIYANVAKARTVNTYPCGLVICPKCPWLGCSPDRKVYDMEASSVLNRIDSLYLSRTTEHQKHRRRGGKPTLTCLFWNVHGRNSACNKLAFDNFLDRSSVTFLSETMLINPSSVLPNDYFSPSASKCTKQGRPSSGIEFNVNPNLCAIVISKAFHHIKIILGTLHIIGVYYNPSTEFDDLHTDLHKALSSCNTPYIVIDGDFNLHYKDTELKDLLKLLDSFHITLCSNPDVHTFFSKKSSSCVDYIFTSHSLPDTSVDILNRSESEHLPLKATIKMDRHDFLHFLYRNSGSHPIRRLPKPGTSAEALNNSNNVAESVVPEASGANSDKVICYCQKVYDASQGRVICCNNPKRSYLRVKIVQTHSSLESHRISVAGLQPGQMTISKQLKDTENRNLAITTTIKTATKNSKHKVCPDIFNRSVGCLSQVQQYRLKIAIKQFPFVVDHGTGLVQEQHPALGEDPST
ncbi:hypothetical protein GQR58_022766 [Nymphon striatum]|nr:hypothetical protein GQR58_022766 [Nymphon striatum]